MQLSLVDMSRYHILNGDVLEVCGELGAARFDAVLCDPPYGLSFMGKGWDRGVPPVDHWRAISATCKPGAPLLAFGGTRMFHRLVCAIEDAGFEIRDTLMWLYGSGFPKNHDVSKAIDKMHGATREVVGTNPNHHAISGVGYEGVYQGGNTGAASITAPATPDAARWDGYGTALKPAYEPICLARAPIRTTVARGALEYGCGALNIDGCRIETTEEGGRALLEVRGPSKNHNVYGARAEGSRAIGTTTQGRWPANIILDPIAGAALDEQAGAEVSRYFYHAKASRKEREAGLEQRGDTQRRNAHPTVKPIALARYLATLILPPPRDDGAPRRLLVPYSGSGSEVIGALLAGWDEVVGVELSEEYASIARARLAHWIDQQ